MENEEKKERDMEEVIAQITWTVQDIHDAFKRFFEREPTGVELDACLEHISFSVVKDVSYDIGLDSIYDQFPDENRIKELVNKKQHAESQSVLPKTKVRKPKSEDYGYER